MFIEPENPEEPDSSLRGPAPTSDKSISDQALPQGIQN